MSFRSKKGNVLFLYTIISFSLTVLLASILSWQISIQLRDQLIYTHGDFYRAYIEAIAENYSEIIPLISGNEVIESSEHDIHGHSDDAENVDNVWSHFISDLVQYPYVKKVRVFNSHKDLVWEYKIESYPITFDSLVHDLDSQINKDEGVETMQLGENLALTYMIPVLYEGTPIGTVHIIDIDPNMQNKIRSTQARAVLLIFAGGLLFYLSLFLLYYRVHRQQARTINRLDQSQSLTIETMSRLAELRDDNTGAHIRRTSLYCRTLAYELTKNGKFTQYLTKEYIRDLERSAPLHDIGKVGVPDSILQKPGPLSDDEFDVIKTHPLMGAEVLREASARLGFQSFFEIGYQIVLYHHENWDGSGYPEGLSGEDIPLSARIMSIADVYDALTTNRPYKEAFSHDKALKIIMEESGTKFDPDIINSLAVVSDQFREIARKFSDGV